MTAAAVLTTAELAGVAAELTSAGEDVSGNLAATLITGGRSNLTFKLTDGASAWVLRMPPRAGRTPSAHDVGREHRVTGALHAAGFPVAKPVVYREQETVIGAPFAVARFVDGLSFQTQADLGALADEDLGPLVGDLIGTLAALHALDHSALGLGSFARPDGYGERQLRRWSRQWETFAVPEHAALADEIQRLLGARLPDQVRTSIVHGDFRLDNTIVREGTPPSIAAVVDWELSTLGDPVADVAMTCAYRLLAFDRILGDAHAWTSPRIADPAALADLYLRAGGAPLRNWYFHLALAYFKIGVAAAGIHHRFASGGATGPGFETSAEAIRPFFEESLRTLRARDD